MKKLLIVFLCLFMVLPLFATGQNENKEQTNREILFTTMNYGDINSWNGMWDDMTDEFYNETGIRVNHEIVNWAQAREKITAWHLGGDAPDVVDMFWSKTYSILGNGEYGTRPIEENVEKYIPDFYERFPASAISDVEFNNHVYGIPWRVDVRPMVYRKDFLQEAGIDPDSIKTWDDLIEVGKKLTITDDNGNITRYGIGFDGQASQEYYSWLWQAGGSFTNDKYDKATVETEAGQKALEMLYKMVIEDKVAPIDYFIDPAYDGIAEFVAGKIAIIPFSESLKSYIENNAPQLEDVVITREPVKYLTQDTFQGAGYFTPTYQCKDIDAAMQWLAFISRTENMVKIGKISGNLTPCIPALENDFFTKDWWFSGQIKALPYGRSTQIPSAAWGAISNNKPGAPIYDMLTNVMSEDSSITTALSKCQKDMQMLMDDIQ